jgi:hypothetical protein
VSAGLSSVLVSMREMNGRLVICLQNGLSVACKMAVRLMCRDCDEEGGMRCYYLFHYAALAALYKNRLFVAAIWIIAL